jgi:hypothetical protein
MSADQWHGTETDAPAAVSEPETAAVAAIEPVETVEESPAPEA